VTGSGGDGDGDAPRRRADRLPGWARPWRLVSFLVYYAWQLVVANAYVAWEVLTPTHNMRPGIIGVSIRSRRPLEIAMLSSLVTLTPGTISVDVDEEADVLYVHGLHISDPDSFRGQIQHLEDRLLGVLR
jgi:multicomponent Na+:H+ antiporter subunit E